MASTAYEKVNATGTYENLFRLVPVNGHGARVLPLALVSGHGAQISARVPKKKAMFKLVPLFGHRARTKSKQGLIAHDNSLFPANLFSCVCFYSLCSQGKPVAMVILDRRLMKGYN